MDYKQKYLKYQKKYNKLKGGSEPMGPKDLNQEIIEQFKAIENNFGTILYRPNDHKYIILFGEYHEINSIEKTRIIEEIIKISSRYEIDIFVEEKFKFMINSRFNKEWINVEYLYDQIKSLPQESVKSRIHNIDIRNSFCYPNNYFHEYNYMVELNSVQLSYQLRLVVLVLPLLQKLCLNNWKIEVL